MGFVPQDKEQYLQDNGWEKRFDSFVEDLTNTKVYPDGKNGSQIWEKYDGLIKYELYISYNADQRHDCSLYIGESDEAIEFKLRSMKSMLKKLVR